MKVAVTGAGGFVGLRLVQRLADEGYELSVLTRGADRQFPAGTRVVTGDLTAADCPAEELLGDCAVVFHCAGEIRNPGRMQALHVDGTARLLAAARKLSSISGRRLHWVQLSSVGVYGPVRGAAGTPRIVTEESPEFPMGPYECTKAASDALVRQAGGDGLTWSIVRPSIIFGAGMPNASLRQLAGLLRRGTFAYIGRQPAVAPYVHVDDAVELLVQCSRAQFARNEVFNLSHDCPLPEMIVGLATAVGVKPPRLCVPESLARALAACATILGVKVLTGSRIDALVARTSYPVDKAARLLGFRPRISVPQSMREIVHGTSYQPDRTS